MHTRTLTRFKPNWTWVFWQRFNMYIISSGALRQKFCSGNLEYFINFEKNNACK